MILSDDLVEGSWTHPVGEGSGERVGLGRDSRYSTRLEGLVGAIRSRVAISAAGDIDVVEPGVGVWRSTSRSGGGRHGGESTSGKASHYTVPSGTQRACWAGEPGSGVNSRTGRDPPASASSSGAATMIEKPRLDPYLALGVMAVAVFLVGHLRKAGERASTRYRVLASRAVYVAGGTARDPGAPAPESATQCY